jgi:hypothetical protein
MVGGKDQGADQWPGRRQRWSWIKARGARGRVAWRTAKTGSRLNPFQPQLERGAACIAYKAVTVAALSQTNHHVFTYYMRAKSGYTIHDVIAQNNHRPNQCSGDNLAHGFHATPIKSTRSWNRSTGRSSAAKWPPWEGQRVARILRMRGKEIKIARGQEGVTAREQGSRTARQQDSKTARQQDSKTARQQDSKRAREQEDNRAGEKRGNISTERNGATDQQCKRATWHQSNRASSQDTTSLSAPPHRPAPTLTHLLVPPRPNQIHPSGDLHPLDRTGYHLLDELAVPHWLAPELGRERLRTGMRAVMVPVVVE